VTLAKNSFCSIVLPIPNSLHTGPGISASVDSARGNLAGTSVNAFVNAGFGNDKLMVSDEEGSSWIYKNKDHGMMSAASLGLSLLWDTEVGLSHIDKYTYSAEEHIKAGALFATGMLNTGIRTEGDFALSLLGEYTENKSVPLKTSAFLGLALAYAGFNAQRRSFGTSLATCCGRYGIYGDI